MCIIAVDWGKDRRKRAAYQADTATRHIRRLTVEPDLPHLLDYAASLEPPVLIGVDAAIGFPEPAWNRLAKGLLAPAASFIDFLLGDELPSDFFEPVAVPEDWTPQRPFVCPPKGSWSLTDFVRISDDGFHRRVDRALNANPLFVTCGMPGSVGSGTQALWRELIDRRETGDFSVWPFHDSLVPLLRKGTPVIAEIYPKACYGIALAEQLPAPLESIAKTRSAAREQALQRLSEAAWLEREGVSIEDLDTARRSEDDFDALLSVAALLRLVLEAAPLEGPKDSLTAIEGDILGAASLTGQKTISGGQR